MWKISLEVATWALMLSVLKPGSDRQCVYMQFLAALQWAGYIFSDQVIYSVIRVILKGLLCLSALLIFKSRRGSSRKREQSAALADAIATPSSRAAVWLSAGVLTYTLVWDDAAFPIPVCVGGLFNHTRFNPHTDKCCKYLYCIWIHWTK